MAIPVQKVEIGFDTSFSGVGDFFTLDDAVKGILDNPTYLLAGVSFVDITDRVRSFSISRGRSNIFSSFPAGQLNVELNNQDRAFDPLYSSSPYFGNILPRREIKVTTNNLVQYSGWVDDWGFSYETGGASIAEALAYDATSIISGQAIPAGTPTTELTGARINKVLDDINWLPEYREIDAGVYTLGTAIIPENTNAMTYLQSIANSENGLVFLDKLGSVTFIESGTPYLAPNWPVFGGTGIPISSLAVSYGSENLYNKAVLSREGGGTVTATKAQSIADYGERVLNQSGLLLSTDGELTTKAQELVELYSEPEYTFSSLEVPIHGLDATTQSAVLGLELGEVVQVKFTPNELGAEIERFVQIISIKHNARPDSHFIEFGFQAVRLGFFALSDPVFGRLSAGNLLS